MARLFICYLGIRCVEIWQKNCNIMTRTSVIQFLCFVNWFLNSCPLKELIIRPEVLLVLKMLVKAVSLKWSLLLLWNLNQNLKMESYRDVPLWKVLFQIRIRKVHHSNVIQWAGYSTCGEDNLYIDLRSSSSALEVCVTYMRLDRKWFYIQININPAKVSFLL